MTDPHTTAEMTSDEALRMADADAVEAANQIAEADAEQAARSPNPEAKAASLARARARTADEIAEQTRLHEEAWAERKARRETP